MSCILKGQEGGKWYLVVHLIKKVQGLVTNNSVYQKDSIPRELFYLYDIAPKDGFANSELGQFYLQKNNLDLAEFHFKKAIRYERSLLGSFFSLSDVFFKKRKY